MESLAHGPTQAGKAPPAERLAAGAAAGDYVIERFLGAGAMGDVYAGRHPVIHKRVAIKVLKRELAASPESAERFVREAQAVNQIDHENVVDIFGFGRLDDGRHYLAMALIDGVSLRARLVEPLAVADALDILAAIAAALDAAHARGVVHRDLKPDNVMLGAGGKVYVLDFGIAKLVSSAEGVEGRDKAMTLTGQGAWLGTPAYMAPEQWSSDGAGPASDRYSLGVMAFELLAGKLPFAAPNLPGMMEQHFRAPVPALSTRGAIAERAIFDPVLQRALAKDPDARFASGEALVTALREVAGGKRFARAQRRSFAPAAIGAGVLGMSILGVLAVRGGGDGAAAAGTTKLALTTVPAGADLVVDGEAVGQTPRTLDLAADRKHAIEVRKPGYLPVAIAREIGAAGGPIELPLAAVSGFDGIWQLPGGKLRRFQRTGDRVDVYEREAFDGSDGAAHTYAFGPAASGVNFTSTEIIPDERSPDPSCRISHRVEYHYEVAPAETLTVALERVGVAFDGAHCVVASSQPGVPARLQRREKADLGEVRYSTAPIGTPPSLPKNALKQRKPPIVAKSPPPPPTQQPIPNDTMDNRLDNLAKGNNEVAPQQANQPPQMQTQAPQQPAPQPQAQQQQQLQKK